MKHYLIIKCGGSVIHKLTPDFFRSIQTIRKQGKWFPIIVHGGGSAISDLLRQMAVPTTFFNGLRVTTKPVLDVAEMVLNGRINKDLVTRLTLEGARAVGLSGIDGRMFEAEPVDLGRLGYVGKIVHVNPEVVSHLCEEGFIPVISPISMDAHGQHYNINADDAAASLAGALGGSLCFVSDVPGIMIEEDGQNKQLGQVSDRQIARLIETKKIYGGMIPKVTAAVASLKQNVPEVVIVNGMMPGCLIAYTNGLSIGTKIFLEEEAVHA